MKRNKYLAYLTFILFFLLIQCAEDIIVYDDPVLLEMEDFTFIPQTPSSIQEISMVYYGCEYNKTSSVSIDKKDILVIKKFNGAMKRPCILEHDTISFGKLDEGSYKVTLSIIDINPFAQDSLFSTKTKTLVVGP